MNDATLPFSLLTGDYSDEDDVLMRVSMNIIRPFIEYEGEYINKSYISAIEKQHLHLLKINCHWNHVGFRDFV